MFHLLKADVGGMLEQTEEHGSASLPAQAGWGFVFPSGLVTKKNMSCGTFWLC